MSNNNQYKYVIYGAGGDQNTQTFLKLLTQHPSLNNSFLKIDVRDKRYKIPSNVKSVPTIVVPGINEPLSGDMAFTWLSQQSQEVGRGVASAKPKDNGPGGFTDWNGDFSSGSLSDNFSYLDGSNIVHNFEFLGGHGNAAQGSGPTTGTMGVSTSVGGGYQDNKNAKSELEKKMEDYQRQRNMDVPQSMAQKRSQMNMGDSTGGIPGYGGGGASTYRTL